jgi:hypothetical protein
MTCFFSFVRVNGTVPKCKDEEDKYKELINKK